MRAATNKNILPFFVISKEKMVELINKNGKQLYNQTSKRQESDDIGPNDLSFLVGWSKNKNGRF